MSNLSRSLRTQLRSRGSFLLIVISLVAFLPVMVCAGTSLAGLTGTMLVPGLDVLPKGGARAALHFSGRENLSDGSFKGVFAFSDDAEVAVVKRFNMSDSDDLFDPMFAIKYKLKSNLAVAAVIDTTEGYKDSIMLLYGVPGNRVVIGAGANIAMNRNERFAHFGSYSDEQNSPFSSADSEVDTLFFVFGAHLSLDRDTEITMDYAGNEFVIGLRHAFDENLTLDFGFYTPDRLHTNSRYLVGANFGF